MRATILLSLAFIFSLSGAAYGNPLCALMTEGLPEAVAKYVVETGGSETIASDQQAVEFIKMAGPHAAMIVRSDYGKKDVFFGKLILLRESPPLFGVEEPHGAELFIHQISQLQLTRPTAFINVPEIHSRIIGDTKPTATEPVSMTPSPMNISSVNWRRLPEIIGLLQPTGSMFDVEAIGQFFKGQPNVVRKIIGRWYEDNAPRLLEISNELKDEHLPLLMDPGIASRAEKFIEFYRGFANSHPHAGVAEVRRAFAGQLGVWKGFRGVMLPFRTTDKFNHDFNNRFSLPGVFRQYGGNIGDRTKNIPPYFDESLKHRGGGGGPTGVFDAMATHPYNPSLTPFISVTEFIEVAQSVAWNHMFRSYEPGIFHLVELEIPQIDLVHMSNSFGGFTNWYQQGSLRTTSVNGGVFDKPMTAPGFEIFATRIKPENIKNIYPYDNRPPGFEIRSP